LFLSKSKSRHLHIIDSCIQYGYAINAFYTDLIYITYNTCI